jgi:hypothetical protein
MRDKGNRDATVYDISIDAHPQSAPKRPIGYFLDKIMSFYDPENIEKTAKWNRANDKITYIRDIAVCSEGKWFCILLYFADKNGMGASFTQLDTDNHEQEDILLENNRARPESAHILISKNPVHNESYTYLSIIEDSNKLNRYNIKSYLNYLFREIIKSNPNDFEAPEENGSLNTDGTPKKYKYKNFLELQGHPSEHFAQCLENGKLLGIALESTDDSNIATGEGRYVLPKRHEILLKPTAGSWHENMKERLTEACKLGRENRYQTTRITFKAEDGKSHTARIDSTTGNIIGDQFVKRHRLSGFSSFLNEADKSINNEIKNKMLSIMNSMLADEPTEEVDIESNEAMVAGL